MSVMSVSKVGLHSVYGDKGLLTIKVCGLHIYMVSNTVLKVMTYLKIKYIVNKSLIHELVSFQLQSVFFVISLNISMKGIYFMLSLKTSLNSQHLTYNDYLSFA